MHSSAERTKIIGLHLKGRGTWVDCLCLLLGFAMHFLHFSFTCTLQNLFLWSSTMHNFTSLSHSHQVQKGEYFKKGCSKFTATKGK
jgi:hypothetical protein